jgi:hypothetical protein
MFQHMQDSLDVEVVLLHPLPDMSVGMILPSSRSRWIRYDPIR